MSNMTGCHLVAAHEGQSFWSVGDHIRFILGPEHTGGTFALAETTVFPGGGPPPHVHTREDELFHVLEGEMTFLFQDHLFTAGPGATVFLPRNVVHTFKNATNKPVRSLVLATPCGFEKFMLEFGIPAGGAALPPPVTPQDIERLLTTAPRYGIEMKLDHQPKGPGTRPDHSRELWVLGEHVIVHLGKEQTSGALTFAEITSPPGGGPPPHSHRNEEETFHILDGNYEFLLGGRTVRAGPGSSVIVPRGTVHTYKNISKQKSKLVSFHSPGGFDAFFDEAGIPCTDRNAPPSEKPDAVRVKHLCDKHGMDLPR